MSTSASTPAPNNKTMIIVIVIVIGVCLISCISSIIGGFAYYNSKEEEDDSSPTPTPSDDSDTPSDDSDTPSDDSDTPSDDSDTPSAPTPSAPTPSAPTPSAPTSSAPTPSAPTPSAPTPSAERSCGGNNECGSSEYCLCPSGKMKGSCCPTEGKRCLPQSMFVDNNECSTTGVARIPGEITFIANADSTCADGYTGNWLKNQHLTGSTWFGATTCQDSPSAKTFLIANSTDCPTGTNKIGWIPNTSILDTTWYGSTMCQYPNERPLEGGHTYVVGNNSDCPVGTKVGWIPNTAMETRSTTGANNSYYGLTICDRR